MLYTVGHTKSYEQGLEEKRIEGDVLKKLGKGKDHQGRPYGGGCVFESKEVAQSYLDISGLNDYSVYGLDTVLENTEQLANEPYRRLLTNAAIIKL